jgi:transaldolase
MKLILISADLDDIRRAYALGVFVGVASNPSVVAEARVPSETMVRRVLEAVPDAVFVQVSGMTTKEMVEEGLRLSAIDPERVSVKVPVTAHGVAAIHQLSEQGVNVTATAICTANEALLGAQAGATYLAPYLARIYDVGGNGCQVVGDIVELVRAHGLSSKVVVASVRTPEDLMIAWKLGADFAAIESSVVWKICANPVVDTTARAFHADYVAAFGEEG